MGIIFVVALLLFVRLGASDVTFEAVAENRELKPQLQELFLDSYDAFLAVIQDGGFKWEDANGTYHVQFERPKLACDVPKLTLRVSFTEELSSMRTEEISRALIEAASQRYRRRLFAASDAAAKVLADRLMALAKSVEREQDLTRQRILVDLMNASGPRTVCEPGPMPFFGLRRRD